MRFNVKRLPKKAVSRTKHTRMLIPYDTGKRIADGRVDARVAKCCDT